VGNVDGLSGWARGCVGLQELDVYVGRDAKWPLRLRRTGISTGTSAGRRRRETAAFARAAKRAVPRRKDFRHIRHQESQAGSGSANLPRLRPTTRWTRTAG